MRKLEIVDATWDREALNVTIRLEDRREFEQRVVVRDLETGEIVRDQTDRETKTVASVGAVVQYRPEDPVAVNADPVKMAEWKARFDSDAKLATALREHPDFPKARTHMEAECTKIAAAANVKPPAPRQPIEIREA